jgi:hypothetical protein
MSGLEPTGFSIIAPEANEWWRKTEPAGALLNRLMILFIFAPIALVFKNLYALSFVVFSLMIPYGFLVRRLAVSAVRNHLANHPDSVEDFRDAGILR